MQLFDLLKADHREVKGIFAILNVQREKSETLVRELCDKLLLHMRLEEQYFYPALEEHPTTASLAKESYLEHGEAKELIKLLRSENLDDVEIKEKLEMLELVISHHVEEEENEIFPKAERAISEEEIIEIGNDIALKKEEVLRAY